MISTQNWKQTLTNAFPKFQQINKDKAQSELGFAFQIFQNNTALQRCEPQSILNAVINVARTSITLNPVMRLAYLIPRKNKCVLEFSYMGLVAMLRDNNCIKSISAHIVYADEEFEYNIGDNTIIHKPVYARNETEHNKRQIIGCYSRATLLNDEKSFEFMPMWEIEKVKRLSESSNSKFSAWNTWQDEMIKKTVIKRHFKMLISINPTEALSTALTLENDIIIKEEKKPVLQEFIFDENEQMKSIEEQIREDEKAVAEVCDNNNSDKFEYDLTKMSEEEIEEVLKKEQKKAQEQLNKNKA